MNAHRLSILYAAAFASLLSTSRYASAEIRYTITDLGNLGAYAVNASAEVVGGSFTVGHRLHAFLYSSGVMNDLGALPGISYSTARDVNNSGQVVGMSRVSNASDSAVIFAGGTVTDLGTLPGLTDSFAFAINDAGQIVGQSSLGRSGIPQAFLYSNNTMTPIGTLPGASGSAAVDINANGQIAVATYTDSRWNYSRGFIYADGQVTEVGILPGGTWSAPTAINDTGHLVGYADTFTSLPGWTEFHAFLYFDGAMTDLGTLPGAALSMARAINNAGVIVGDSQISNDTHAFVYSDGKMHDLNDLIDRPQDWILLTAADINASGQIVGVGYTNEGQHGFLLTPVPEPTSLCLFTFGILAFPASRRSPRHRSHSIHLAARSTCQPVRLCPCKWSPT